MSSDLAQIFSRLVRIGGIGEQPSQRRIIANAAEREALAASFGIPAIAELAGDFSLVKARSQSGTIDAGLALQAKVTQICVVSLEPFDSMLTERADLRFLPAASIAEDAEIAELGPESLEGPDEIPYVGEMIDLGAVLAEQLALALDPYPRKPGAELPRAANDAAGNAFAALDALKGKPANDAQ